MTAPAETTRNRVKRDHVRAVPENGGCADVGAEAFADDWKSEAFGGLSELQVQWNSCFLQQATQR